MTCAAVSLTGRYLSDPLHPVMLVSGFGILLAPSLAACYLLRRPYWQRGVVSMALLGMGVGVPLLILAQALTDGLPRRSAAALVLDWATVQALFIMLSPIVAAVLWLPVAVIRFRRSRRDLSWRGSRRRRTHRRPRA
ncbi:hypothetical protein [Nonomuraea sp. MG754425]|uniref:hypothetical protein n=1 Tax=Nonomuraea sp. MG754425 TaxID=2570319 RepID=UPI001F319EF5|nr:hypothetical protein [Nonomuraea sp. MG754425]